MVSLWTLGMMQSCIGCLDVLLVLNRLENGLRLCFRVRIVGVLLRSILCIVSPTRTNSRERECMKLLMSTGLLRPLTAVLWMVPPTVLHRFGVRLTNLLVDRGTRNPILPRLSTLYSSW